MERLGMRIFLSLSLANYCLWFKARNWLFSGSGSPPIKWGSVYFPIIFIRLLWRPNEVRLWHRFQNCNIHCWYGFGNFNLHIPICMCHLFLIFHSKIYKKSKGAFLSREIEGQRINFTCIIITTTATVTLNSWRSIIYFPSTVYTVSASFVCFTWNEFPSFLSPGLVIHSARKAL